MACRWQPGMKITALLDALNSALAEPFALAWSQDSPRFLLVFTVIYAVVVIVAVTDQKNTRPGAEHGSAAWGDVFRLNKFYMDKRGPNLLLTQHFYIGIDGYKHKHNTNILIVGGSGAGKTRTYGVPNVLECACSMVITDPKAEILRKTGNLLKQKGYEVIVFDLINPAASFCYNPFVYVHDDREVLSLIENLIQNTTPSHSKSSDPFWEKSETALLQALMLYLLHEAPPEEQNFPMVMEMIAAAEVHEDDDTYQSPLDILFERLEMREPDSIACKQYRIFKQAAGKTAKSILVSVGVRLAAFNLPSIAKLKLRSLQAELAQKQTEYARLTKPVAADSYDLEKAQQALQAAYQAAENSAAAWAEKEANAGSERDALQRELNERQEKAAQYAREIAEKQAQRELLQQEESPDEEIISRIEAELTQLTAEETQNREALAEAEARLNEADAALESVQSQREEAARTAAQAAEQAEQARNDARHAYEKSVEAASETAAANAASATVLAEQIREMESSVETLKKLDEQEGVFCAPQTGTVESLQLMQGQTSGQVGGSISDPERGYQIRFALEAEDAVQDTAGVTVTVMQGAKSESVKINSSVSQQDGGVVLSAALTGSDWQVGKAELTIRLSETEYDCCLPVSALHSDNGGDFVYSVEERNTILGLQNIVRKVYVEVVERNNELAALRNYTTGAPVVAATTKSLQEGARVRTAG